MNGFGQLEPRNTLNYNAPMLKPLYDGRCVAPAYQLRYGWTAWPTLGYELPAATDAIVSGLAHAWESDGLRLLEHTCTPREVQAAFSATPVVAPVFIAQRGKGRLEHALRQAGRRVVFQRNFALRTIGDATRLQVEQYVCSQVTNAPWADSEFGDRMRRFTVTDPSVDLAGPAETERGRYWYNLHVVLVTEQRSAIGDERRLTLLRDQSLRIARRKGYAVSCLSVMPDHLHIALRGAVDHSPQDIALAFQNNLAYALGQVRVWRDTYYVGTFGEYDMDVVRRFT